eukprot:CAMPEP_0185800540 /NCGR_PEP_ID=MMETSP1322-20130828/938_1 /TAXON_ID=265543 /ORGANISM="Minutocellus polymorphus, Strain RCC2270" /LENGTH=179 /DNA_ID=CAMNT_0028496181 /DNA_START=84 /DNA_END=627 /DNA_ORIENTATION=-
MAAPSFVIFILFTQQGSSATKAKQTQQKQQITPRRTPEAPLPASHSCSTRVSPTCSQNGQVMDTGSRPRSDRSFFLPSAVVLVLVFVSAGGADGAAGGGMVYVLVVLVDFFTTRLSEGGGTGTTEAGTGTGMASAAASGTLLSAGAGVAVAVAVAVMGTAAASAVAPESFTVITLQNNK